MAVGDQRAVPQPIHGSNTGRRDSSASTDSAAVELSESLKAKCTHHAPRKRLFTRLQALVTSPKRAYEHAERDGLGGIAGALTGRHKRESISKEDSQSHYRERLASDASLNSPGSGPRSSASPPKSLHSNDYTHSSTHPTSPQTPYSAASSDAPYLTSSPVKREDKLYSPSSIPETHNGVSSREAVSNTQAHDADESGGTQDDADKKTDVLLRPHLKLRVVTWNMHDSLPTGDLTELLGAPSPACDAAAAEREKCKPYDPDHAVQPLSSALDHDAPYHLVVVGGQEVPVGYGGWSGPNWTETIHRWLSGTAASPLANGGSQAATDERPSVSENDRTSKDIASPASPNTAHRAYLESQSSETLVLSEDVVDIHERSQFPAMEPRQLGRGEGQQYKVHAPEATTSMNQFLSPDNTLPTRSPALLSSTKMGRSGSSSTTDTDRSACTDAKSDLSGKAAAHETTNADQVPIKHSPHFRRKMRKLLTSSLRKSVLWAYTVPFGYIALVRIWCKQVAQIVDTRFLFVCAHLAAHSEKSALRQANVRKIKEELVIDTFLEDSDGKEKPRLRRGLTMSRPLMDKNKETKAVVNTSQQDIPDKVRKSRVGQDITDLFDHTFWFGDLNFRLDISRLHADFLIKEKKFDTALTFDQLQPILKDPNGCFGGFSEAPIKFAPSYKYDVLKLKRNRTVQRANNAPAGLGLTMTERRTQTSAFMSPTAPTSLNASRTNLAADIVNEEDEDDGHNAADRVTLGSSRVSISSAFSGFEPSMTHGSDVPDHETLANTHYNNRSSASFFGSSLPSTPTTEKVFEKAKGLFHLMRARSPTHTAHAESEARAAPDYEKSDPPANSGADLAFPPPPPMVAAASSQDKHAVLNLAQAASTARVPAVEADPGGNPPQSERPNDMDSGLDGTRKQSLEVPDRNKVASTDSIRPTTPLYSPRPRLKSMRSANTVLSVSSFGLGKSASSIGQEQSVQDVTEDATYDTSSKKRVQSWTDRILFKSNIVIEDNAGHSTMHRSLLSGTFLPSFRITGRNAHEHQVDLNRISSRIGALAGEFQDRSSSLHKSDAAASNEQGAMYKRQNSSTSSLPGSQQRLNGRIAGLFRRRSSDKRSISSQLYSNGGALDNTKDFDRQDLNLKAEPAALTPGVRQSSHADSEQPTHHDSSGQLGANPTDQAPRPPSSDQTNPAIHVGKVKPHRAFTSPLPEGRVEALSHGAETLHPDAASRDRSYVESSDDQSAGVTSPLSAHTLSAQAVASGEMLRHGSEPLRSTLPSRVHSSPDETTSPYVDSVANQSRRSSARGNPFSRSYYKDQVPLAPLASGALAGGDKTSRPAKTGITILPSQTTPVTSDTHQTEEKPHARLRHWWNARMLPHIFPFHSEAHVSEDGPSAQPVIPGASNDVPEPRVVGPRRGEVQCIYYDSVSDLRRMEACSDHRPVVAVFAIGV